MVNDGKQLEHFVAFVEETLVPRGFKVVVNRKIIDDAGNQIAEFDVQVSGRVGTGDITWLIECRDRPSQGAAPVGWIEQLVGRRDRFNLNRVTAVSTTGFSAGAREFAEQRGIDLRELRSSDPKEFSWIAFEYLDFHERVHELKNVTVNIVEKAASERAMADIATIFRTATNDSKLLVNSRGETASIIEVFFHVTEQLQLWNQVPSDGARLPVRVLAQYNEVDRFVIKTDHGDVSVGSIGFEGELFVRATKIAPETFKYRNINTGEIISEVVRFAFDAPTMAQSLEIHRIVGAETMPVIIRRRED